MRDQKENHYPSYIAAEQCTCNVVSLDGIRAKPSESHHVCQAADS